MGLAVDGDDAPAPAEAPAQAANAPAVAAAPAAKAPVAFAAAEPPAPPPPDPPWVATAKARQKIPYWVMPVLLFLPIWLIMYVGTLEESTRQEGVLYEGSVVFTEAGCSGCHGASGGGGSGPAFAGGLVIETFAKAESHMAWVVQGSQNYLDSGLITYGDNSKEINGFNGTPMPAFGADLTAEEIVAVVFYERIELGGDEDDLEFAELVWEKIESGELELPEHFAEGPGGDFAAEIEAALLDVRLELGDAAETASE